MALRTSVAKQGKGKLLPDSIGRSPGITVDRLNKTFRLREGVVRAIDNLTLTAPPQKILTLLGPSGCGKTTLLRCIAGLEIPDTGEIRIGDNVVFSSSQKLFIPPHKRGINMVFQSYAIWPHMAVFDNVAYPLKIQKVPKDEITRRVKDVLALVQLSGFERRSATKLSGGQQQRVALARALVGKPKVLLLDEPLSNLDAKLREQSRKQLKEWLSQLGITAVYVTHDRLEALTISDVIAVMDAGRIIEIGTPKEMYLGAKHKFVASFIGDANFVPGEITRRVGDLTFVKTVLGEIACKADPQLPIGTKGTVCMRPEIFELVSSIDDMSQSLNMLKGMVEQRLFTGESYETDVRIGNIRLSIRLSPYTEIKKGDLISLFADPERCQFIPE